MEKRVWESPLTMVQKFEPNEYIAACGDENRVYLFTCDAGWTGLSGSDVWTNGADGIMGTEDDQYLGTYGKCGKTHEANTTDEFIGGYLKKNVIGFPIGQAQKVIIWRGEDGNNIHCTTNLDMKTWPTAKS